MNGWLCLSGLRLRSIPWMTAAVLALVAPAYGVAPAPQIRIEPTTLYFGAATPPAASAAQEHKATLPASSSRPILAAALKAKAADGGTVRVIVQLATPFTPEGRLAGLQIRGQRQAIGQAQDAVLLKLAGPGAKLHARYGHIPFLALEVDAATLDRLAGLPEVAGIAEDAFEKPSLVSSNAVIGSGVAWSMGLTGAGQTIAILDTGVDKTHPYFASGPQNKVVSEACYSSNTSLPGYYPTTTVCPGGVTESTAPGSGVNCSLSTSVSCEHGTHVAGIAAGNDGVGPAFGVARDANVIAIQVFSSSCYGTCIGSWISDQIKGLERVYELADQYHIAAVNMSLGGYPYETRSACDADNQATKAAIDNLRSLDIPTVAAAGNDYSYGIDAPACISSTIAVSATDDADIVPYFANIHPDLDLMAPGVAVDSSIPGGGTASLSGTSMSAPHVAGAWAILRQQNSAATVADVRETLRATAVQVGGFGYDLRRINLGKAVTAGPFVTRDFVIYNDGNAVLSVLSEQLETPAAWIRWTPEAPFDVPPGGSRHVSVTLDFGTLPAGASSNRLIVGSTDGARSPYPDAVHLVIDKEACYPLTRLRDGTGGYPDASPSGSPGCPAGQYYAGQAIQLTGRPGTGWGVQAWSGTDNDASTAGTNTLTMPAAPRTVKATYYALCYSLSLGRTGSGSDPMASPANSVGCPAGQYRYAEPIQLTAAPSRGWRVGGWTNTGADASHKKTNSLAMPAASAAVSVNYTEGLPSALLVVDSSYSYYASPYTAALTSLGTVYDVWNLATGNPDAATLAQYPRVIWESGYYLPTTAQEGILTIYLAGGGSLFLSSQQDYGATSFFQSYLGVAGLNEDFSYNLTGQGSALSGLGPFSVYPWNTTVTPAAGAEVALQNEYGQSAGVSKIGPSYRTLFVGSAFQNLDLEDDQRTLLGASLDFLGTVFADIPRGYWAKKWIEAMYRNGVTSGCSSNPRQYCPEAAVTRGQMAVFLLLAKEAPGYSPPPCATAPFNDVPASNPLCPWIKELARRGVTSGCGGGSFCPDSVVTRDQMSVFLLSTLEGPGYAPPACLNSTPFVDVPASSPFCPWVAELARRGISSGCNPGTFCPSNPVNRAQMAVFLVSNFHLPIF